MTQVLIALIALIPAFMGFANRRGHQLSLMKSEVELLKSLPDGFEKSKNALRQEIAQSVHMYSTRHSRLFETFLLFGWSAGVLTLWLGVNLYQGTLSDPSTVKEARQLGAIVLIVFGAGASFTALIANAIRGTKSFRAGRKAKR